MILYMLVLAFLSVFIIYKCDCVICLSHTYIHTCVYMHICIPYMYTRMHMYTYTRVRKYSGTLLMYPHNNNNNKKHRHFLVCKLLTSPLN